MRWQKQQEMFDMAEYLHSEHRSELTANTYFEIWSEGAEGFSETELFLPLPSPVHLVMNILSMQTILEWKNLCAYELHNNYSQKDLKLHQVHLGENLEKNRKEFMSEAKTEDWGPGGRIQSNMKRMKTILYT